MDKAIFDEIENAGLIAKQKQINTILYSIKSRLITNIEVVFEENQLTFQLIEQAVAVVQSQLTQIKELQEYLNIQEKNSKYLGVKTNG